MNRADEELEKSNYQWFTHYDPNNPIGCVPENVTMREQRIYVWLLLTRVFKRHKSRFFE